ncbi:MAG: hypothetical protein KU38_03820 [Sulfurovum sp. FS08-3]|nr:MAG: hypothetical protein KU38_03820 [Sulfurovum sp. FS08-3]
MESLSMTLGIVLFVWAITLYVFNLKKQKLQEDKERRLKAFEDKFDLGDVLKADLTPLKVSYTTPQTPLEKIEPPQVDVAMPPKPVLEFKEYLEQRYQKLGYTLWKHQYKELDGDIVAKQGRELLFVRSIHSSKKASYRLTINDIKAFRVDVGDFIDSNPPFANYQPSLLLVLSDEIVENEAKAYIERLQTQDKKIDYKVIAF